MPIFTLLGNLKGNMLGFKTNIFMAVAKEITTRRFKGPRRS